MKKNRVVMDAGHGIDTFPPSKGIYLTGGGKFEEHDFNAAVTLAAKKLAENNGFEVYLSQEPYTKEVALNKRIENINNEHIKDPFLALISFHANYNGNKKAKGYGVFYWHNSNNGKELAELWNKYAGEILDINKWGNGVWESKPKSWTNFGILRYTLPPAILPEHFFFSNLGELKRCNTPEFIEKSAEVAVRMLCEYAGREFKPLNENDGGKLYKVQVGAYTQKQNAENLLNDLSKKGFKGFISEEVNAEVIPEKLNHEGYEIHGLSIIDAKPENCYVAFMRGKTLRQLGVYGISGVWQNTKEAHLKRAIWGLLANKYGPVGPNSYQNSPDITKKRGTVVYYEDKTLEVIRINNLKELKKPIIWAIGGGSLYPEMYKEEDFASDIYRYTAHAGVLIKNGRVLLVTTAKDNPCTLAEFKNRVAKLKPDAGIFIDGGDTAQSNYPGIVGLHTSRPLASGFLIKGDA